MRLNVAAMSDKPRGAWAQALYMAERTPEARNRYVDFLRAASILVVVVGHWVMAAPYLDGGSPAIAHLLDAAPWTQWLTWGLQVMPVFFFVGGFSNGISWGAALRDGKGYSDWLSSRLKRLLGPVLPLIFVWGAMAAVAHWQGVHPEMIRVGSQIALVPTWFLAVYVLVACLVPLTYAAWRRLGYMSIALLIAGALLVDLAFFSGFRALGWINYLFVWLAVHQLGYAWQEGRLKGVARALFLAACGIAALVALTELGPYPRSLVGVPSDEISNTLPPKLPLLALGAAQIGLLLALEGAARRWLRARRAWALTVLVNGMIMTVFLWHSTVMMLLFGLAFWIGGVGLAATPASSEWWMLRPLWVLVFTVALMPVAGVFARFERPKESGAPPAATWRLLAGSALCCFGLAMLALDGVGSPEGFLGLRILPLLLPALGAGVAGFGPLSRR